jgi:membrane protein implicated in regulation of membrane protease activity
MCRTGSIQEKGISIICEILILIMFWLCFAYAFILISNGLANILYDYWNFVTFTLNGTSSIYIVKQREY